LENRIRVDTDLLAKTAGEFHQYSGDLKASCETLLSEIGRLTARSEYASLQANASADGFIARGLYDKSAQELSGEADTLLMLSRAFREIDDTVISLLESALGEDWLKRKYLPAYPDIDHFEPFFVPETRMATDNWVFVYTLGPNGLSRGDTRYVIGKNFKNIVGIWIDPQTGEKYYIIDLGDGQFGYIPIDKLGPPVDLIKIPDREGVFTNSSIVEDSSLTSPWGDRSWPQSWIDNQWWIRGNNPQPLPQQDLLLKYLGLLDDDGNFYQFCWPLPTQIYAENYLFLLQLGAQTLSGVYLYSRIKFQMD
jgi:uncharacterized protein YukE